MLLGWSVLGWIVAFVWALTAIHKGGSAMSKPSPETMRIGKQARAAFR